MVWYCISILITQNLFKTDHAARCLGTLFLNPPTNH